MEIVYDLYRKYGEGLAERELLYSDGLIPVERRLLLGLYKLAKNKLVKSAKVVGDVFGRWHPHSTESIYQTLVKMVNRGLAIGQGNFGKVALNNAPAAAMRYTEVRLNPKLLFIFDFIDYVEWKQLDGTEEEPTILPSPFPLLIGYNTADTISFWKMTSFLYDIKTLLLTLLNIIQKDMGEDVEEYIPVPTFYNCYVDNNRVFEEFFKTGKGKCTIYPMVETHRDGIDIIGKFQKNININKIARMGIRYRDLSAKNQFRLRLYKRRGVRLEGLLKWPLTLNLVAFHDGKVYENISLENMFRLQYYDTFLPALLKRLEYRREQLQKDITKHTYLNRIKEILISNPSISKEQLIGRFNENEQEIVKQIIQTYPIQKLITFEDDIVNLNQQLTDVNNNIRHYEKVGYAYVYNLYQQNNN